MFQRLFLCSLQNRICRYLFTAWYCRTGSKAFRWMNSVKHRCLTAAKKSEAAGNFWFAISAWDSRALTGTTLLWNLHWDISPMNLNVSHGSLSFYFSEPRNQHKHHLLFSIFCWVNRIFLIFAPFQFVDSSCSHGQSWHLLILFTMDYPIQDISPVLVMRFSPLKNMSSGCSFCTWEGWHCHNMSQPCNNIQGRQWWTTKLLLLLVLFNDIPGTCYKCSSNGF